jgi:hypothetical protein
VLSRLGLLLDRLGCGQHDLLDVGGLRVGVGEHTRIEGLHKLGVERGSLGA